jgi:hypothetical protein
MDSRPILQITEKLVYGTPTYYAAGPLADPVRRLTGKKTLNQSDLHALSQMGFKVELATSADEADLQRLIDSLNA